MGIIAKPSKRAGKLPIAEPKGTIGNIHSTIAIRIMEKFGEGTLAKKNRIRKRLGNPKAKLAMSLLATDHMPRIQKSEATASHPKTSPGH